MRHLHLQLKVGRIGLFLLAGLIVAGIAVSVVVTGARSANRRGSPARRPNSVEMAAPVAAPVVAGSLARFNFLADQRSNRCSLGRAALLGMPNQGRLQGSCCFPMNLAAYRSQVRGLRRYASISQIPRDPFDISVVLAKRLLRYQSTIRLTAGQRRTYARAMRMSVTKGPCCCHCWRWDAFKGLSDYLIADREWGAAQVATVVGLVEGCGGPARS